VAEAVATDLVIPVAAAVVVTIVVLDLLVVAVDMVLLDLTLNVPLHDILLATEIILLYLLDEMILILRVMGLTMHRRGEVVRDTMTVLRGDHRRVLGGISRDGVIGEKNSLWHQLWDLLGDLYVYNFRRVECAQ